uniref:PX domain-containing protein n=1 Tax=Gasterosteus aculeatus aculeatus TaxID=481459 RepID=A0AAQ4PBD0_GASAC
MIEVSIPSMEKEVDESGKSRKLFRVEVLFNGRKHFVLRRNSEFQTLHRKLRKIIQTPDLPSKRNPHLRTKPLQQRSQELEDYVQLSVTKSASGGILFGSVPLRPRIGSPRCRRGRRPSGSLSPRRPGQLHRDRPRHVCVGPKSRIG